MKITKRTKQYDRYYISAHYGDEPGIIKWGAFYIGGDPICSGVIGEYDDLHEPGLWDELVEMAEASIDVKQVRLFSSIGAAHRQGVMTDEEYYNLMDDLNEGW